MKELIKKLIEKWTCKHNWEEIECVSFWWEGESAKKGNRPAKIKKVYICKNCGKFHQITF